MLTARAVLSRPCVGPLVLSSDEVAVSCESPIRLFSTPSASRQSKREVEFKIVTRTLEVITVIHHGMTRTRYNLIHVSSLYMVLVVNYGPVHSCQIIL